MFKKKTEIADAELRYRVKMMVRPSYILDGKIVGGLFIVLCFASYYYRGKGDVGVMLGAGSMGVFMFICAENSSIFRKFLIREGRLGEIGSTTNPKSALARAVHIVLIVTLILLSAMLGSLYAAYSALG